MFEDNEITVEKVKDLLYATKNEFENELDYDYFSEYKENLSSEDFDIMFEFLNRYIGKIELYLEENFEK